MISNVLREGMKIDIHIVNQTERPESAEKAAPVYKSQIFELFENGEMEIMMPIQSGKLILLPLGLRYEFVFYTPNGLYKSIGQIWERYKTENRYMLRIVLNTPLSKYQRREYYRMECVLDMGYFHLTDEESEMEQTEDIIASLRDDNFYKKQKRSRHERYRHLRRPRGQFEKYLSADTTGEACGTHGRVRFRKIHVADRCTVQ